MQSRCAHPSPIDLRQSAASFVAAALAKRFTGDAGRTKIRFSGRSSALAFPSIPQTARDLGCPRYNIRICLELVVQSWQSRLTGAHGWAAWAQC
jgi:hypothetical protein